MTSKSLGVAQGRGWKGHVTEEEGEEGAKEEAALELGQASSTLNWTRRKRDSHVSVSGAEGTPASFGLAAWVSTGVLEAGG